MDEEEGKSSLTEDLRAGNVENKKIAEENAPQTSGNCVAVDDDVGAAGMAVAGSEDEFRRAEISSSQIISNRRQLDLDVRTKSSDALLSEVPVEYSWQFSTESSKDTASNGGGGGGSSSSLKYITDQLAEVELPGCRTASSAGSPKLLESIETEQGKQSVSTARNWGDGYKWRKYGQKQVKSPEGSRSYYRCTYSNCHAKKIECCHHSSPAAVETVYRSQHNHDPPLQKPNCPRENNTKPAPLPTVIQRKPEEESCGSDDTVEIYADEEDDPRQKKNSSSSSSSSSLQKPGKKPKFVVHAADDVGISGDGYRWRKYGQKMVKGNPHPRNYYRCTSAGCPVRKHIERALDGTTALVITYKGVHDHGMPVPRTPKSARSDAAGK